jgi:hypothetical protein
MFIDQNLIKEMIRMEKNKIEKIIISSIRNIFVIGGQEYEEDS